MGALCLLQREREILLESTKVGYEIVDTEFHRLVAVNKLLRTKKNLNGKGS